MTLSYLIDELVDMYKEFGDFDVEIMREGNHYQEIEIHAENDVLYLEAYKANEN